MSSHNFVFGDPTTVFDLSKFTGPFFKLGLDGTFRSYRNVFADNTLAQNKAQKADERDRRRHLSSKYYVSADRSAPGQYEFRWHGQLLGVAKSLMATVKGGIVELEKTIHPALFHPAWSANRAAWLAAVEAANEPGKLARQLLIFEASCRSVLFTTAWHETLGVWLLFWGTECRIGLFRGEKNT